MLRAAEVQDTRYCSWLGACCGFSIASLLLQLQAALRWQAELLALG